MKLAIDVEARFAQFQDSLDKMERSTKRTADSMAKSFDGVRSVLGALGIGLSVGYFVSLIKGSIDAADRLHDLSKSTGIAVEQLAGLKLASKQSGGDLDSIGASINKLSQNMGKEAEKFRALGISAKDPLQAFKQLADVFVAIEDPQLRAAVAAAALGKSWAGAAPLLSEGGAKIQEMVDKGTKLSGITKEMTDRADELNDKWAELVGTGGLLNGIVNGLLGPLLSLTNQMIAAKNESTGFLDALRKFFSITSDQVANPDKALESVNDKLEKLRKTSDEFGRMGFFKRIFSTDDMAIVQAQIKTLENQKHMLEGLMGKPFPKRDQDASVSAAVAARAADFVKPEGTAKAAKDRSGEDMRIAKQIAEGEEQELKDRAEAFDIYYKLRQTGENSINETAEKSVANAKLMREQVLQFADDYAEFNDQIERTANEVQKVNDFARDMGLTFSSAFENALVPGAKLWDLVKGLSADVAKMIARKTITEPLGNAFTDMFKDGGGFGDFFKNLFSSGGPVLSAAGGTDFIPRDGFAFLHKGEAVVPASQNAGGIVINQSMTFGSDVDRGTLLAWGQQIKQQTVSAVFDLQKRGVRA